MTVIVGIIAEDKSDVDVIDVIISKCTKVKYSTKSFVGNGCGRLRNKCRQWADNLRERGCSLLVFAHDLDANSHAQLRAILQAALGESPLRPFIIVIPVREIEAWLLADQKAICSAMNIRGTIKRIKNPEALLRPKESLRDIIYRASKKKITYLNTIHNEKIARQCELPNLRRCESFKPLQKFIEQNFR
jgi:hypothetical protein